MRRLIKSWIALLAAVAVLAGLTSTIPVALAAEMPKADVFEPGRARMGDRGSLNQGGDFGEGRGRAHELPAMRTEESNTYVMEDGRYQTEFFPGAVNYKDSAGRFQPIDNTLVAEGRGQGFTNKANDYRLHLPSTLDGAPVRMEQDGHWVSFSLDGAHGRGEVSNRTATYAGALPGVDVEITAQNEGIKENLVLASTASQSGFDYTLRMDPHLTATETATGAIDLVDDSGTSVFTIPAPYIYDSAMPEAAVAPATRWTLDQAPGRTKLSVAVDQQWLNDPLRAFPVVVDPSVSQSFTPTADCTLNSASATQTFCTQSNLEVGKSLAGPGMPSAPTKRALLRFNMNQTVNGTRIIPIDAQVLDAQIRLNLEQAANPSGTKPQIVARRLTADFNNSATWNSNGSSNWASPGGDFDTSGGYDGPTGADADLTAGFKHWWYPTAIVDRWLSKPDSNKGILLKLSGEGDGAVTNMLRFTSMEGATNLIPKLTLTWDVGGLGQQKSFTYETVRLSDRMKAQVNVGGGNLLVTANDLNIKGTGLDLKIDRYYNGLVDTQGLAGTSVLGNGWTLSVGTDVGLNVMGNGAGVIFYGPSGVRLPFQKTAYSSNEYISPPSVDADLKRDPANGTFSLKFHQTLEKFTFNSTGRLTTHADKNGETISSGYTNNLLTSIVDTQDRTTTLGYNGGRLTQISDPSTSGRVWSFGYNANGMLSTYTDPSNFPTSYEYDASNRLTKITDPLGNQTKFQYGTGRAVTAINRVTNNDSQAADTTSFSYDLNPQTDVAEGACCRSVVTDPIGNQTTYDYRGDDRVVRVKDARNNKRSVSYNSAANVNKYVSAKGGTFHFTYDDSTNRDLTQTASGQTDGSPSSADLAGKTFYKETGDLKHLPTCTLDAENHETYFKYDGWGNLTNVWLGVVRGSGGAGSPNGSAPCDSQPTNAKSHYVYAYTLGERLLDTMTDGRGNVTDYTYDPKGNLTRIDYPGNGLLTPVQYTYDSLSRVATMTDGNGTTQFSYDKLDRLTQITYQGGTSIVYTYDADGNLKQRTDAVGQTTFDYTRKNQLKSRSSSVGTSEFTYDAVGNLSSLKETPAGASPITTTYLYDAVNVLRQVNEPGVSQPITFSTDNDNNRTHANFPGGVVWRATYANTGEMERVWAHKADGTVLFDHNYGYKVVNGDGSLGPKTSRIQQMTEPMSNGGQAKTVYSYDLANRLTKAVTTGHDNGAYNKTFDYSYDANSNLATSQVGGQAQVTYEYDAVNRLTCKRSISWCDSSGPNATTYTYDTNGNLTSRKKSNLTEWLTYNSKNQMISVGSAPNGGGTATMTYGDSNSTERATKNATTYSYDLLGLASEVTSGSRTFYTRDDKAKLLSMRTASSGNYYYLTDVIGSVVAVAGANGNRVGSNYRYEPFGATMNDGLSGTGVSSPFRFGGGYFDPETALLKFGTRYYDPSAARWTQPDPVKGQISNPMSLNPYLYVENDPINRVDPSGRSSCVTELVGFLGGGVLTALTILNPPASGLLAAAGIIGGGTLTGLSLQSLIACGIEGDTI